MSNEEVQWIMKIENSWWIIKKQWIMKIIIINPQ
jgi:hypothetical protein